MKTFMVYWYCNIIVHGNGIYNAGLIGTTVQVRNQKKSMIYFNGVSNTSKYQYRIPMNHPKTPPYPCRPVHLSFRKIPFSAFVHKTTPHHGASLASIILFPPMVLTLSTNSPLISSASTSSPPPMLLPLISTLGTVRRPVLCSSADCKPVPRGCLSNSTTYGEGTMLYFSSRIDLAFFE